MLFNKKTAGALILIIMSLFLSTSAYARPVTDVFTDGLLRINDFFTSRQYEMYSSAIDFFFFSLLFISIYMIGVRYAFKEVKRPEQVIAILLGLMTAFLLVLGGFSITVLLPYVNWILYIVLFILYGWLLKGIKSKFLRVLLAAGLTLLTIALLQGFYFYLSLDFTFPNVCEVSEPFNWIWYVLVFILFMWLLKGIKNRFWRFVLALLLTILVIALIMLFRGCFTPPDFGRIPEIPSPSGAIGGVGGYFKDTFANLKKINLGFQPGVPNWLNNLFKDVKAAGPTGPRGLEVVHPEAEKKEEEGLVAAPKPLITETANGILFDVDPSDYKNQKAYDRAVEDLALANAQKKFGEKEYFLEKGEKEIILKRDDSWSNPVVDPRKEEATKQYLENKKPGFIEKKEGKIEESDAGTLFGIDPDDYATQEAYNAAVRGLANRGTVTVTVGENKYEYEVEIKDNKPVLERKSWPIWNDPEISNPAEDEVLGPKLKEIKGEREKSKLPKVQGSLNTPDDLKQAGSGIPNDINIQNAGIGTGGYLGLFGALVITILFLIRFNRKSPEEKLGALKGEKPKESEIKEAISRIEQFIKDLNEKIQFLNKTKAEKDGLLKRGENKQKLLEDWEKASPANLWTEEGRKDIRQEHATLIDLLEQEEKFRKQLNELRIAQISLLAFLDKLRFIPENYKQLLKKLSNASFSLKELKKSGILNIISSVDASEKSDEKSLKELQGLMIEGKIGELVKGKFSTVKKDWETLEEYNKRENNIMDILNKKIKLQNWILMHLIKRLSQNIKGSQQGQKSGKKEADKDIEMNLAKAA
ncbi:hypothetical protein HYS31_03585 [Candidatus Woesearchaeota archaeon]|nr:hypothetical protein [Candidatus Woesearchaeota archaeon]